MGCGCVRLARCVGVGGILLSALAIAPPAYTFFSGRDHSTLLPWLNTLQERLLSEYHRKAITLTALEHLQGLLNSAGENAGIAALAVVSLAATNIVMDLFLLIGACCRVRCLLLPWLIISMVELILLGCPTVICFSLLGAYLLIQGLFLPAILSFSTPTLLVLLAMAIWLTVLAAYWALKPAKQYQEIKELLPKAGSEQPPLPPERPLRIQAYQHSQFKQYNNPRHMPPQTKPCPIPSAPNPNLYPTLPLA